jgi:hypothetical protein
MENTGNEDAAASESKDAFLSEIFIAYREAGVIYKITADAELKNMMLAIRHFLDLALQRLLPLNERFEKCLIDASAQFSD